jgi:hypothetical protein
VRGLDASDNPYRDKYQEWDRWAMAHAKDQRLIDWSAWNAGETASSTRMVRVIVDRSGYPLPLLESCLRDVEKAHAPGPLGRSECTVSFLAFGEMPPELLQGLQAAEMACKARYLPRIPQWLAQSPPQWAIALPNGEAVTMGELGSGQDVDTFYTWCSGWNLPPREYCRYSAQGRLLGKLKLGDEKWYTLFWPQAQQALSRYDQAQTMVDLENGCIAVRRYPGKEVLAAFDYDGTPLPAGAEPRLRDGNVWRGWFGLEITALYAAQQRRQIAAQPPQQRPAGAYDTR